MPGMDGLALLKALRVELPASTVIVLTGPAIETAVAAMRDGAYDYLTKPVDLRRLRALVDKALEQSEVLREVTLLRRQLGGTQAMGTLIGASAPMQEIYRIIEQAASTSAPVLISGESGTGKELAARTIHVPPLAGQGPIRGHQLRGHPRDPARERALRPRAGRLHGRGRDGARATSSSRTAGTLFLDEIAEMSAALQAKYLRVLQDGVVRRLGGGTELKVDVRIIAATNRDPREAIKQGAFREDLYYRLNVFSFTMPPLRVRKEDIPLLAEAFVTEFAGKYDRRRPDAKPAPDHPARLARQCARAAELDRAGDAWSGDRIGGELPFGPPAPAPAERPDAASCPSAPSSTSRASPHPAHARGQPQQQDESRRSLGISLKTLHNKLQRYAAEAASQTTPR